MKKITIKLVCLFFSLIFALAAVPLSASAARVTVEDTNVIDDLSNLEGFKLEDYPKNEKADYCSMIAFHEYGYDFNKLWYDYGLYVYIYNPSGKEIPDSVANQIQLAAGENGRYKKYPLVTLSKSDDNVFYKYKVGITDSFVYDLLATCRKYNISGIELKHKGERNSQEYLIESSFEYSGYDSYHDRNRSEASTLRCKSDTLETVSFELHDASWKTATSDKGVNHQYEISTVYFAIPNYFLEKYGSEDDLYKGLYAVACEWYEYKVNGLVTNHNLLYQQAVALKGKNIGEGSSDVPFTFKTIYVNDNDRCYFNCYGFMSDIIPDKQRIVGLHNVFRYSKEDFEGISTKKLKDEIFGSETKYCFKNVDPGRSSGYNNFQFTVEDGALNTQIASYASNHDAIWTWLNGNYSNLWIDRNGYPEIEVFKKLSSDDFEGSENIAAENLFVSQSDYSELKQFYNEARRNDCTAYLLRFAVTDYVFAEISVNKYSYMGNGSGSLYVDANHYYFEKTVFDKFDVIDMTFEDESNAKVTLPVAASPITIVGTITPGPTTGGNDGREEDIYGDEKSGCASFNFFDALLLTFGVALLFAVILFVIRFTRRRRYRYFKPRVYSSHRRHRHLPPKKRKAKKKT